MRMICEWMPVTDVSRDVEKLLAVAPADFVHERSALARALRDDGRRDEAQAVEAFKKPPPVVLAVNRAARERPQAAKDAAKAAERLGRAQLSGKPDEYRALVRELDEASGLLGEFAVAHLTTASKPTDAMRRRVADHIRGALSSNETRRLLARGALTDEIESSGFDAYAELPLPKRRLRSDIARSDRDAARARRARDTTLKKQISAIRGDLADAERRVRDATRERDDLATRLDELEAELRTDEA
jgi:hypothetical protein